jgi:hypothetical protein
MSPYFFSLGCCLLMEVDVADDRPLLSGHILTIFHALSNEDNQ